MFPLTNDWSIDSTDYWLCWMRCGGVGAVCLWSIRMGTDLRDFSDSPFFNERVCFLLSRFSLACMEVVVGGGGSGLVS